MPHRYDRCGRPRGSRHEVTRVEIEVGERVVHVHALRTREEDVLRVVLLVAHAKRQVVVATVDREVVLELRALVAEFVVRRERLETERRQDRAGFEDVHHREERPARRAALVVLRVTDDHVVGHVRPDQRVPLADERLDVLHDLVIRILEVQAVLARAPVAEPERRRVGEEHVGVGRELRVTQDELVLLVQRVVELCREAVRRRLVRVALIGTGLIVERSRGEERAERIERRSAHARDRAAGQLAAGVRGPSGAGLLQRVRLVAREEEELVLEDRAAEAGAELLEIERARVEPRPADPLADPVLVSRVVVERAGEVVRARLGHRVHRGADEVALAHVEGRDVHLHRLDRVKRDRRDARAVARLAGETERVIEVRPVDRDVVEAVVHARE